MNSVFEQSRKHNLPVELILVDWNPPEGKPLLQEVLPRPAADVPVTVRYIVVPAEVHRRYRSSASIPLFQMIAKNVGIRRATGDFVLCTNVDILFSDRCFAEFASHKLRQNVFYRANRCDVPKDVLELDGLLAQLSYCEKHIIKRLGKSQGHETLSLPRAVYFFPNLARLLNSSMLAVWKLVFKDVFPHFTVDFDACGDFTLMSHKDWEDIEGYVELDMYSIHIDSMALWAASALGKKQIIFPYDACVYHIYHEDGWESTDALRTIKFLENKPCLDYSIVFKGGMQIIKERKHWGMNRPDWGLADLELDTTVFKGR